MKPARMDFKWYPGVKGLRQFTAAAVLTNLALVTVLSDRYSEWSTTAIPTHLLWTAVVLAFYFFVGWFGPLLAVQGGYGLTISPGVSSGWSVGLVLAMGTALSSEGFLIPGTLACGVAAIVYARVATGIIRSDGRVLAGSMAAFWAGLISALVASIALALLLLWLLIIGVITLPGPILFAPTGGISRMSAIVTLLGPVLAIVIGLASGLLVLPFSTRQKSQRHNFRSGSPRDAEQWQLIAEQYEEQEAWPDAALAYQKALAQSPNDPELHCGLGDTFQELSDYPRAEQSYKKALELDPDFVRARHNLAILFATINRPLDALCEFQEISKRTGDPEIKADVRQQISDLLVDLQTTCAGCGVTSPLGELFGSSCNPGKHCPRCLEQDRVRGLDRFWGRLAILTVLTSGLAIGLAAMRSPWWYLPANLITLVVIVSLLLVIHELGHALAIWLTGGRVFEIRLGSGPPIFKRLLFSMNLVVNRYLDHGACFFGFFDLRGLRWRMLVTIAAGAITSILFLACFIPQFEFSRWWSGWAWRESIVVGSLLLFLSSVIPSRASTKTIGAASDGFALLEILSHEWRSDLAIAGQFEVAAYYAYSAQKSDEAAVYCERGLVFSPDQPRLKSLLACAWLDMGWTDEARCVLEDLVPDSSHIVYTDCRNRWKDYFPTIASRHMFDALNMSNLAYTLVLTSVEAAPRRRARDFVDQAYSILPWIPNVVSTVGVVMLTEGDNYSAIAQFNRALALEQTDRDRAVTEMWLALAHWRVGQLTEAKILLQQARSALRPDHPLVERISSEVLLDRT